MKLSKEELRRINEYRGAQAVFMDGIDFLIGCIDKLRTPEPKPERFTYEMRDCVYCDGTGADFGSMACSKCGGLGKTRVKVKRTAHSV